MGNTWTVEVYGNWLPKDPTRYTFNSVYSGESMFAALFAMWKHRNAGTGCVQLSWRPARP